MLAIKDIKQGDTFYECEGGFNDEYTAGCDPFRKDGGWAIIALPAEGGDPIEFYCRDGYCGVRLYSSPEYV